MAIPAPEGRDHRLDEFVDLVVELASGQRHSGNAAALIDQTARFALDVGHHIICEGIRHSHRYGAMLTNLIRDHRGKTSVFYLDVSFEETLRRHASCPQATPGHPRGLRGWYVAHVVLAVPGEHILGEDTTFDDGVDQSTRHLADRRDIHTAPPAPPERPAGRRPSR